FNQLGWSRAEIIGVLLLPAVEQYTCPVGSQVRSLGNTFAALTELHHFSSSQVTFSASFDEQECLLHDQEPPFSRCVLLPQRIDAAPISSSAGKPEETLTGLAGGFLFGELVTPLGGKAEACRVALGVSRLSARTPAKNDEDERNRKEQ